MNQLTDIVSEDFQQDFINLSVTRPTSQRISEHPLDCREGALDVRALMVVRKELVPVEREVGVKFVPEWIRTVAARVDLERDEYLRSVPRDAFKVTDGRVGLVCR